MAGRPDFSITMGLVGASTIVTGLASVWSMLDRLVTKVEEWSKAAAEYGDVVNGHAVSVQRADIATQGLVDTLELHRQAARLEAAGIQITAQQYQAITVAATEFARRTGGEVTEAVQQLTSAVISANSRGLRPYGIELSQTGSLAQRQQRVIEQLTGAFGDQRLEIEDTDEAIYALKNNWGTAWSEMLLAVENNAGPIRTAIQGLNSVLSDFNNAMETQRRAREHIERMGQTAEMLRIQNRLQSMGYDPSGRPLRDWGSGLMRALGAAAGAGEQASGVDAQSELEQVAALVAQLDALQRVEIASLQQGAAVVSEPTRRSGAAGGEGTGGGGGGRRSNPLRDLELADTTQTMFDAMDAIYRAREELAEQDLEKRREVAEQIKDIADRQVQAEIDANDRRLENMQAFNDRAVELWQKEAEERERSMRRLEEYSGLAYQTYGDLLQAVGGLAGAMAENAEEQKKIEGGVRVAQQVGALLYATTQEVIAIMDRDVEKAVAAGVAIAVASVNLAKTITEYGVQSRSGTTGAGSRSSRGVGAGVAGGMAGGRQPNIAVYFTGPVTSRRARDEVVALERDGVRGY